MIPLFVTYTLPASLPSSLIPRLYDYLVSKGYKPLVRGRSIDIRVPGSGEYVHASIGLSFETGIAVGMMIQELLAAYNVNQL